MPLLRRISEIKKRFCEVHHRAFECVQRSALKGTKLGRGKSKGTEKDDGEELSPEAQAFFNIFRRGRDGGNITLQCQACLVAFRVALVGRLARRTTE